MASANPRLQLSLAQADLSLYQASTLGKTFLSSLQRLVALRELDSIHIPHCLPIFDRAVADAFTLVQNDLHLNGDLQTYRFVDKTWVLLARNLAILPEEDEAEKKEKAKKEKEKRSKAKASNRKNNNGSPVVMSGGSYGVSDSVGEVAVDEDNSSSEPLVILSKRVKIIAAEARRRVKPRLNA